MMQNKIRIRKAEAADITMMQNFIFLHGKNPWNFLPEENIKAHIAEIASRTVEAFLAELDDECVGFVCFYEGIPTSCKSYEKNLTAKVAYLSEIVTHNEFVGLGIGTSLIQELKKYLSTQGFIRLYAERHSENLSSAGVMFKNQFKIMAEYDDPNRRQIGSRKTVVTFLDL